MNEERTNQPTVPSTRTERVQMETLTAMRQAIIYLTYVMRSRYEVNDHETFDAVLRNISDLSNQYLRMSGESEKS